MSLARLLFESVIIARQLDYEERFLCSGSAHVAGNTCGLVVIETAFSVAYMGRFIGCVLALRV